MNTLTINIPKEATDTMQRLSIEVEARASLINRFFASGQDVNHEVFQKYHDEYVEYFSQYEVAKHMIEEKYIPEEHRSKNTTWELNFWDSKLTVTEQCGQCSCGDKDHA